MPDFDASQVSQGIHEGASKKATGLKNACIDEFQFVYERASFGGGIGSVGGWMCKFGAPHFASNFPKALKASIFQPHMDPIPHYKTSLDVCQSI